MKILRQLDLTRTALIGLAALGVLLICVVVGGFGWLIFGGGDSAEPTPVVNPTFPPTAPSPAEGEPSGSIVYTCFDGDFDQLCVINVDGSEARQVTNVAATDWYASFSPTGLSIAFSTRRNNNFEIYLMGVDGSDPARLTQDLGGNYAPEVSPDGTRVVFVSTINGKQDIYTMAINGADVRRITTDPGDDIDPTWSPDGMQIAFTSNRTETNELYIINADSSEERQVTSGGNQREGGRNDWSPDGMTLAFYAGQRGDKDIFLVAADCVVCGQSRIVQLTDGGNNKAPGFSPDGMWITFASNLDGENNIFIMRVDGSDWRQITDRGLADWQPRWGE